MYGRTSPLTWHNVGGSGPAISGVPTAGGGGGTLDSLIQQFAQGQNQANQQNLAQYQNLMGTVNQTGKQLFGKRGAFSKAGALMAGAGTSAHARVDEDLKNDLGGVEQDMINRGLGNTSIRTNRLLSMKANARKEHGQIDEQVAAARAGLLERQAGMKFDMGRFKADSILSRMNEGPDMNMYLDLIRRLSASQQSMQPSYSFSNMGSITALNG